MTPQHTFARRGGVPISYADYFEQMYHCKITDRDQPLLKHVTKRRGASDPIYLVPELCHMTGFTDAMRADMTVMRDVAQHTRVNPDRRGQLLEKFLRQLSDQPEVAEELNRWNMSISPSLLTSKGRQCEPAAVRFGGRNNDHRVPPNAEWASLTRNAELLRPMNIDTWVLIHHAKNLHQVNDLVNTMSSKTAALGMRLARPHYIELSDESAVAYTNAARRAMEDIRGVELVVFVLPTPKKERYDAIKKLCTLDMPIPSQCIVARSLSRPNTLLSVCLKILHQMNCKVGGSCWMVEIPLPKTMIVGIDVCHDTARGGRQSVCGFVVTLNEQFTEYWSRATFQGQGQELIDGLRSCMVEGLRAYEAHNKCLPERVIIYRDGVGDGMMKAVQEHEVRQFQHAFVHFDTPDAAYRPKMIMMVVKKHIHTRLFLKDGDRGQLSNPGPGTVLDRDATQKDWYDFFLISQSVRQGTVMPTHFVVVADDSDLAAEHVQQLTYDLTHTYFNWAGTIRVPAPCQYAHKLSFLTGQSLHNDPNPRLRTKLFYL